MSVIRRAQEGNFTIMPNSTIRDPDLSLDALGLLVKLISMPPTWEVRPYKLREDCRIGRDKLRRLLAELQKCGYLVRTKSRNAEGKWDWVSEVYQEAQNRRDSTTDGLSGHGSTTDVFSVDGSPVAGKHGDIKKTEIKKQNQKKQIRESRECSPSQKFTRRDLVITDEMRDWAASVTPLVSVEWESQIFVDHPTGQSQRFNSTEALLGAWRTWMMRGQKYAEQQQPTSQGQSRSLVDGLSDTSWAEGL